MGRRKYDQFQEAWFADYEEIEVRRIAVIGWEETVGINSRDTVRYLVQWEEDRYDSEAGGVCKGLKDDYADASQLFDRKKDAVAALKQHLLDKKAKFEEQLSDHLTKMRKFSQKWKIKFYEEVKV